MLVKVEVPHFSKTKLLKTSMINLWGIMQKCESFRENKTWKYERFWISPYSASKLFFSKIKKVIGSVDFVGSGLESFQTFYADIVILIVLITLSLLNFNFCWIFRAWMSSNNWLTDRIFHWQNRLVSYCIFYHHTKVMQCLRYQMFWQI